MNRSWSDQGPDDAALAQVIPLHAHPDGGAPVDARSVPAPRATDAGDDDSARAWKVLMRRYGDRWSELPDHLGRMAAGLERLLVQGPMRVDADTAKPADVVADAWATIDAAVEHAPVLTEEATVLGEALGVALVDLPLRQVDEVIDAVVALHEVAPGAASWANPADADAAHLVIEAHADDVEGAADLHRALYERFTDRVWDLRESRLRAALKPLGIRSRMLLRADVAAISRTGVTPGRPREMADLLLRARAARRRLADLAPLLERHLGRHHQGPRTDVATARGSLAAVRQLQHALGDRLVVERLRGLLMADAFRTSEVVQPALDLGAALARWQVQLESVGAADPWALPIGEIGPWATETGAALPAFAAALSEVEARGHPQVSLRQLVDALLLREHAAEAEARSSMAPATSTKGAS